MSLQSNTNNDIFIVPSQSLMQFSGSSGNTITLQVEPSGAVNFVGTTGSILKIMDNLSGSLFSVNNISGLSILEVFSNNQVKIGNPANYALIISGSNVIITGSLVDKSTGIKFLVVDSTTGVVYTTGSGGGGGSSTTPGGSPTQIQYNSGSAFGGVPDLVYSASFGLRATGSFTGSFTGSLLGTASWASSASQAISSSYVKITSTNTGTLTVNETIPGEIKLTAITSSNSSQGSTGQLQYNAGSGTFGAVDSSSYNSGQLTLGNLIATGSLFGTASYINIQAGPRIQAINYNTSSGVTTITGSIGGSDTQIQFNSGSAFSGSAALSYRYISDGLQQGLNTFASGNFSHAQGNVTTASGLYSHAEGDSSRAQGETSHAEGSGTLATGVGAHAEGQFTTASGQNSHAEGGSTKALAQFSHAEGTGTVAFGTSSHAEGWITTSSGNYSHTEGWETKAFGVASHAEGFFTVASGNYQHVQGQYNRSSSAESAFIIGNGTSDTNRSNLIFASGSQAQITGSLRVTGSAVVSGSFDVYNNNDTFFTPKIIHDKLTTGAATNPYMSLALIDGLGVSGSALEFQVLSKGTTVNPYFAGGVNIAAYPQPSTAVTTTSGRPIKFLNSIVGTSDTGSFEWHYNTTLTITGSTLRAKLDVPSGNFMTSGSINIASDSTYSTAATHDAMYFGTPGVIGSWRIALSGSGATSTLNIERWDSGTGAYGKDAIFTSSSTISL